MERCDVLIVGGGPAGSSCAWRLRHAGLDVMVLDKKEFPRDKVCAGWITPAVVEILKLDVEAYRQGRVFQPISRFRSSLLGGQEIITDYGEVVSYGIRRCEFDHYLLQRSGARRQLGAPLKTLERRDNHWLVNGEIRTAMLVGAGGHFCPVARYLNPKSGKSEQLIAAQEVEFRLNPEQKRQCKVSGETPELFFLPELDGYAWCFRKGDYLNIGLGREDNEKLSEYVTRFHHYLASQGKAPTDLPDRFHGHAYLLYQQALPRRLFDEGVLLIGDAAGLAFSQSGEGIGPAVESGLLAAEVILLAKEDYRFEQLRPYEERLTERFGERQGSRTVMPWVPSAIRQHIAARLLANAWFTRHVVLDRWFLHRYLSS